MKVENMTTNSGAKAANQFLITTKEYICFQSYDSTIARIYNNGDTILDSYYWDYSVTTGRYRNQFLNEGIKDTRVKIKTGEYQLKDLNNENN